MPSGQIGNIKIEETANIFEIEKQDKETLNIFEKNMSNGHIESHIPNGNIIDDLQPVTSSYQALTEWYQFISIKRVVANENQLLQATKIIQTFKKKNLPA